MKTKLIGFTAIVLISTLGYYLVNHKSVSNKSDVDNTEKEENENEAVFTYQRWKYEADMIKDPTTGEALFGLREQEVEFAKTIPVRNSSLSTARTATQNTYLPAGPNNQGGRARALAYDVRYNGTTNRVIISGGVSGGLFRSADGGATWTNVMPDNGIPNISCVAQDPRGGSFSDTWYAGGGEYIGSSPDGLGAVYLAHGLYKSTDNGQTWTRLSLSNMTDYNGSAIAAGVPERFDHPFDYVHKIAVNPVNGDVYVACHRRVVRSTNAGTTFQTVFGSGTAAFAANGQCDIAISPTGKIYIAFSGSAPDLSLRGIWKSASGDFGSYTRLAGGSTLGVDSVANWRGNAYSFVVSGGSNFYNTRRTLMAIAPSNENILYVLYENGLTNTSSGRNKEADLFKLDMTSGNNWTNLSDNLPDFPGGDHDATDPFTIQGGYDLFITVKPNNPNFVLLGGTSLYRSTDGFATTANTSWIGGYGNTLPTLTFYQNSHPDIHNVVFNPVNFNEVICSNDGGLQITSDINAAGSSVVWTNINNFQTLQYYGIAIDPETGSNNFTGGAQDNGTQFRDKTGITGTASTDSNNHKRLIGGDGGYAAISKKISGNQYLFGSIQYGNLRRGLLQPSFSPSTITPTSLSLTPAYPGATSDYGEFVTNFILDPSNSSDLYYVNFNRLFRTTNSLQASASSGWAELTGVSSAINPSNGMNIGIRALALSWGDYLNTHSLYIGTTDGRVFRLDDPRNTAATASPVEITPPSSVADMTQLNVQNIAVNPNNDNEILIVTTPYGRTNPTTQVFQNVVNILWCGNAKSSTPTWKAAEGNLAGTSTSGFISARSCMITVKKDPSGNAVTEYYVGTSAGLFATENLGTILGNNQSPTWQLEGASTLKFAVISSLAYRPSDNVLLVGTHGNGMYYAYLGTPNYNPVTGINDPVMNDKNFIKLVYPTISNSFINYTIGNKPDVKKISVQLIDMTGKIAYWQETGYQNGSIDVSRYPAGAYILSIYSDNRKYRHVQKIIR